MSTTLYHEAAVSAVDSITKHGLRCTSRGAKGDDSAVAKTDTFLDNHRPDHIRHAGVSRDDNLYAFIDDGQRIVSITDGRAIDKDEFIRRSGQAVFRLRVDPDKCFVSDLDAYDLVKKAVEGHESAEALQELAEHYWKNIVPLKEFSMGTIRRPEIMITCDIPPDQIELVHSG